MQKITYLCVLYIYTFIFNCSLIDTFFLSGFAVSPECHFVLPWFFPLELHFVRKGYLLEELGMPAPCSGAKSEYRVVSVLVNRLEA